MAYTANRGPNDNMSYDQEQISPEDTKKEKQQKATKDALKVGAKAAGAYFGGGAGAAGAGKIADSKVGDKILNEGAEKLNKIPGVAKKAEKLEDSGATEAADKATDLLAAKGGGGAAGAAGATGGAANAAESGAAASGGANAMKSTEPAGGKTPASSGENKGSSLMPGGGSKKESDTTTSETTEEVAQTDDVEMFASVSKVAKVAFIASPLLIVFFIILVVITAIGGETGDFEDALAASSASGGDTGGYNYNTSNPQAKAFYDRINEAKSSMESEGEEMDVVKLVAVYHIINRKDSKYNYDYFTTSRLREIARQITRDREETKANLAGNIFPEYFPNNTEEENQRMAEEVYQYIDNYNSLIGHQGDDDEEGYSDGSECTGGTGVCTYNIKGFNVNGSIRKKTMNISNLQVRLMQCGSPYGRGSYTTPINQPLVPFENYVTGVSYAEIDTGYPKNAQQAQMIVARNFALARPTVMGNSLGKKLAKENGKWILQISSCVADQVFCNVDKGCSYTGGGDGQGGYVVSGTGKGERSKSALPANSKTRTYANEVQGMLLVDKNGYVVYTNFQQSEQNQMNSLAKQNYNYKQILLKMYPKATSIYKADCGQDNCSGSTGDYAKWRQADPRWSNVPMGTSGKTLGRIGCLATSVAMLIAKSGVDTSNVGKTFNPGTFVKAMNKVGGFDEGGKYQWYATSKAVPGFQYVGQTSVRGKTKAEKVLIAKNLTNKGYYVVAEVKGATATDQHWVAIDKVLTNSIAIMDPGYGKTMLWDGYYVPEKTTTYAYFKANK